MTLHEQFSIESGIPLPNDKHGRRQKYPFHQMNVGDSFAVAVGQEKRAITAAGAHGKKFSKRFSVRKHGNAFRCWRTA